MCTSSINVQTLTPTSIMQTAHSPHGYHCARFDTALLEQIVSIDVDTVVRRLSRERGISVDSKTQRDWTMKLCEKMKVETMKDLELHTFLPGQLEHRLHEELSLLMCREACNVPSERVQPRRSFIFPTQWGRALTSIVALVLGKKAWIAS